MVTIRQVSWFLVAGASAAAIEFLSFLALFQALHMHLLLANAVSFSFGLITSFLMNRQWTFLGRSGGAYDKKVHHQFAQYCALAGINLLFMTGFVGALVAVGVLPTIAKVLGMITISIWNFVLYKRIIFKKSPQIAR